MIISAVFETEDITQLALTRLREAGIIVQSVNIQHRSNWHGEEHADFWVGAGGPMNTVGLTPAMGVAYAPIIMAEPEQYPPDSVSREVTLEIQVSDTDSERAKGILRNAYGRKVKAY